MSPEQQLAQLTAGTAKVLSEKELLEKLRLGRALRGGGSDISRIGT